MLLLFMQFVILLFGSPSLEYPRWGQTREKLFVTIVVKSLERTSVRVDFEEDGCTFLNSLSTLS